MIIPEQPGYQQPSPTQPIDGSGIGAPAAKLPPGRLKTSVYILPGPPGPKVIEGAKRLLALAKAGK